MSEPIWGWVLFLVTLLPLLAIDLYAHRKSEQEKWSSALTWSIVWVTAGLMFGVIVWRTHGSVAAQEYYAAYLLEKSLSLDNLFVFLLIFRTLKIPTHHHRKALSWGVMGAFVFRAIFIVAGTAAIERWRRLEFVFAVILFAAAIRVILEHSESESESRLMRFLTTRFRVSANHDTSSFLQREQGKLVATPLLIAVVALELSDVLFAVDSVPAALSVTRNVFVVYTSNALAICGLRALYVPLAHSVAKLNYLQYGLALVLAFVGFKMATDRWVVISPMTSVAVVLISIGISIAASVWQQRK